MSMVTPPAIAPSTSAKQQLPETPFNGIVIAREVSRMTPPGSSEKIYLKVSLVIMQSDGDGDSLPLVGHSFLADRPFDPKDHIRVGHSVKVHTVQQSPDEHLVAGRISFDLRQLATDFQRSKSAG